MRQGDRTMEGRTVWPRRIRGVILLTLALTSCAEDNPSVENLPEAAETLASVGKRLIQSHSVAELNAIASRGDHLLNCLNSRERDALARGYLKFQVDRPSDIYVVTPRKAIPFWIEDLGFTSENVVIRDRLGVWNVYKKRYGKGWVGLGVNGLDQKAPAHYAVVVCPVNGDPSRISGLEKSQWEVIEAREGVSLAKGINRPVLEWPAILRGSTLLRTSDDLRHSTRLARGRVWKTHVVSSRRPDQICVAFGNQASGELVWTWRTSEDSASSLVRFKKAGSNRVEIVSGTSKTIAFGNVLNDPVVRRHTVHGEHLEPSTAYEYCVGDGENDGWSPWSTVRTAPKSGDVSFLYMGDPQCGLEGWGKLLAAASRKRPKATALFIAGDLVDRGNERTNWDHFFLRAAGVFETIPLMPCAGNHEYLDRGPELYRSLFALPTNGPSGLPSDLVYSFEAGDAFIAVLDSTAAASSPEQATLQARWLDDRLKQTARPWKVVMFHHPVYASHTWREYPELRERWVPIFDRHHVDLVLQGHDHAYLRTYPMRAGRQVASPSEGTVYVVAVSGDKYCEQDRREYGEVGFTGVSTYQTIDLVSQGQGLVYRSFDVSGRERDAFTIEKTSGRGRVARVATAPFP